jgi:hypothetical protein
MNPSIAALAIVLSAMALTMIGCTSNLPFRTNLEPGSPGADPSKAVIEAWPDFKLGFVEFDDQGWFWDHRQAVVVEEMVRKEAGLCGAPAAAKGIILVAFVHGWKDNAAYDGFGVRSFRTILQKLSDGEKVQALDEKRAARQVVGVYVGWRGLTATWEPFKELSFWERKDTAHKVGGYGAMTQLLTELENIQKDSLDALAPDAPRTELIIIGHSFGGAAVYSALSQIIVQRFVNSVALPPPKNKRLKPLGDQIILLNPAFEAGRHYDLNQMAVAIKDYPKDQRPVLSIFTSEGDWATHYVFPIGRIFSTLFDSYRPNSDQRSANLNAVGWFEPFITHHLCYDPKASFPISEPSSPAPTTQAQELSESAELVQSVRIVETQRGKWRPGRHPPVTYNFDKTVLEPVDSFTPGDPFLVVSVDKQIMKDHTDIANPTLIKFIREYIQFCQADPQDHSK